MTAQMRYGYKQVVHHILKPSFALALEYITGALHLAGHMREKPPYDQAWLDRLHAAIEDWKKAVEVTNCWHLDKAIDRMGWMALRILEVEPYWAPRWWNALIRSLRKHKLLEELPEPPR